MEHLEISVGYNTGIEVSDRGKRQKGGGVGGINDKGIRNRFIILRKRERF